eukprot:scaffold302071_cov35-Tisochrysis_lutea.AAC.2
MARSALAQAVVVVSYGHRRDAATGCRTRTWRLEGNGERKRAIGAPSNVAQWTFQHDGGTTAMSDDDNHHKLSRLPPIIILGSGLSLR